MMNYGESEQKKILRMMESGLLALLAINLETETYEIIYSDGSYRNYEDRFQREQFFKAWAETGVSKVYPPDRERMLFEISKENLKESLGRSDAYITRCRFMVKGEPRWCRVKIINYKDDPGIIIIGIKNIDEELRQELLHASRIAHPHYLYNVLGSVREIIQTDPAYAADVLYDLTVYMRSGIRAASGNSLIPFSKELEDIRSYINIEKVRFGNALNIEYRISSPDFMIIPLGVLPLVENAVKHGLYENDPFGGTIIIEAYDEGEYKVITVSDNGTGFDYAAVKKETEDGVRDSTGLLNLEFRYETMMQASLEIESAPGKGTKATVKIPFSRCRC